VPKRNVLDRLLSYVEEAVRAGRFQSKADFLKQARLSRAYFSEFKIRLEKDPDATMLMPSLQRCAQLLGVSVADIAGEKGDEPDVLDVYEGRAWAIQAARNLKLPEAAIQNVLKEDPGVDPGRMFWFRRIESEALRIHPELLGSPPPDELDSDPQTARSPSRPLPKP